MPFTNEELSKKLGNNFKLVNKAILLANNKIESGRDFRVKRKGIENFAELILEEIREEKDDLIDLKRMYDNEDERAE